jgi:hypothetical protein
MSETPYFYFVVVADTQMWPYYVEIPYTAWPDETMYYNSNGDCQQPYDREWSYLDVMNWETKENLVVSNARGFSTPKIEQERQRLLEEAASWGEEFLTPAPIIRLVLHLSDTIPAEYCKAGNVVIASLQCGRPELSASVVRLFMRRLQSDVVWDGQTNTCFTLQQLTERYLGNFPLKEADRLADKVCSLFSEGEARHRAHPEQQIGWWKTLDQVRAFLQDKGKAA